MRHARLFTSLLFVSLTLTGWACAAERPGSAKAPATPQATPNTTAKTVVYYFHGTSRCQTCRAIEAYADEAVKAAFAAELRSGELQWKPTNVDEAANQHFIQDYQLFTRSLVVTDGSTPKRFKNLSKVWQLVSDKPAFLKYVQDEVRAFQKP
jgi:hypothetical protein